MIYDATGHPPILAGDAVVIEAPLVGRLDSAGRYISGNLEPVKHSFTLVLVDGEWRIANPPDGVMVSEYLFERTYHKVPLYFLNRHQDALVADWVYLTEKDYNPTNVIEHLLEGPSTWLSASVTSAIPEDTQLSIGSIAVDQRGVATLPLSRNINALPNDQRLQLAAQVMATLRVFPEITGLKIMVSGGVYSVPNNDQEGIITPAGVSGITAGPRVEGTGLYGAKDGLIGRISATGTFDPIAGTLGLSAASDGIAEFAIRRDSNQVATISADRTKVTLSSLIVANGVVTVAATGTGLHSLQFFNNELWFAGLRNHTPVIYRYSEPTGLMEMALPDHAGSEISSFAVSYDSTRIAITLKNSAGERFGMARIAGTNQLHIDGWQEMVLSTSRGKLNEFKQLHWSGAENVVVIGSTSSSQRSGVYQIHCDGSKVTSLGPIDGSVPVTITTSADGDHPELWMLSSQGEVWIHEDQSRWRTLVSGIALISHSVNAP